MDTKSKNSRFRMLIIFLILLILPAIVTISIPGFYRYTQENENFYECNYWFRSSVYNGAYIFYPRLKGGEITGGDGLASYYYPQLAEAYDWYYENQSALDEYREAIDDHFDYDGAYFYNDSAADSAPYEEFSPSLDTVPDWDSAPFDTDAVSDQELLDSLEKMRSDYEDLSHSFTDLFNDMEVNWGGGGGEYIAQTDAGDRMGSESKLLQSFLDAALELDSIPKDIWDEMKLRYDYAAVVSYTPGGKAFIPIIYGASRDSLEKNSASRISAGSDFQPESMSVLYAVPKNLGVVTSPLGYRQTAFDAYNIIGSGFEVLYFGLIFICGLLGLILSLTKALEYKAVAKSPFEIPLALGIGVCFLILPICWLIVFSGRGHISMGYANLFFELDGTLARALSYSLIYLLLVLVSFGVYFACFKIGLLRTVGIKRFFTESSLIYKLCGLIWFCIKYLGGKIWHWLGIIPRGIKKLYHWMTDVDLTQHYRKKVCKLVLVNFIIVTILCCLWFFGIIGAIIYSILLYVGLGRFLQDYRDKYNKLLMATTKMAYGKLDVEIDGDLGVFSPLGQELSQIKDGFKSAVAAETKSQNMKTELVTNVSHDLKTPLTAIITYVELLKDESITEDERKNYIDTLDRKSQRLKRLIDDLFDISKASSGDEHLNLQELDLKSVLQQVELDSADEIQASGVEFRNNYPDERVLLTLDGEKTSRIFENLIINVTKYSLPGSRAYIELYNDSDSVTVEVKNISQQELDFGEGDITERFVRGDESRNTQGSGLGLAIVRSFTELQGGSFNVHTDGDLFKAIVSFPL